MKKKYLKEGDKCPCCEGKGSYLEEGDAHRSTGWVPCRFWTDEVYCSSGIIKEKK